MFKLNLLFVALITVFYVVRAGDNGYKLEFVQIMYRHGDRAPKHLYPTDPNPASSWPLGLGSLTSLGKQEHYLLGKLFRKMYEGFITTNPTEVDAVSTDADRCISSAEANFASFFAPTPEWKIFDDIDWQPIPITILPLASDKVLGSTNCPGFQKTLLTILNSKSNVDFNKNHQKLYKYLTKYSGSDISNFISARDLYHVVSIEKKHNLTVPNWVPSIFDQLMDVAANSYSLIYSTPEILKLRAGPVLGVINGVFKDKMSKQSPPNLKFRTYSTHDVNIGAVLGALDSLKVEIIHYCSSLIFELYSMNGKYFVRILFLNTKDTDKFNQTPRVITLQGCGEYCPYQNYFNVTNRYARTDYELVCHLDSSKDDALSQMLSV